MKRYELTTYAALLSGQAHYDVEVAHYTLPHFAVRALYAAPLSVQAHYVEHYIKITMLWSSRNLMYKEEDTLRAHYAAPLSVPVCAQAHYAVELQRDNLQIA